MKKLLISLLIVSVFTLQAQKNNSNPLNDVNLKTYLLLENQLIKGEAVLAKINSTLGDDYNYTKEYQIQVNDRLHYEIGEVQSNFDDYSVMFIKSKKKDNSPQIEFLMVYKKKNTTLDPSALEDFRNRWMELCNTHKTENLISELYFKDAYYYNRGRLLKGTKALSIEYSYMKSPNYNLKLSPKYITTVNDTIAFEIGRCSGSYPLPYLLLWKKEEDGNWKILLDSNF